ncbi:unnamed protein product [Paramecium octaurelia]|uniref:Transmembrane protein n=1 Tax=Paramecium octaurelia TaxID=43137 RepID=A0A8S1USL7_PAROT|nr:unnamed protein product [Paramecium octaurelia]
MFYDYNHNGFLLTIFICNVTSIISLLLIILFYIVGNGSKYLIQKLYFFQVMVLLVFFVPQTIGPFFYSEKIDSAYNANNSFTYCQIYEEKEITNQESNLNLQNCMTDGYCKFQGITNNGAWFASSLFSFLSCHAIYEIIVKQRQIKKQFSKYLILIVLLTILCNLGSCFAKFRHYGITYDKEIILYICNLDLVKGPWMIWWIFQLMVNLVVLVFGMIEYIKLRKSIKQLQIRLHQNLNSIKALKIQILLLFVILFWTINIFVKLFEEYALYNLKWKLVQIILFMFMLPVQLLGLCYAQFYFYSFQDHLYQNLPPCFRFLLNILVQINFVTFYFSYHKKKEISMEDDKSSTISNEASLIYNQNEILAN